MLVLLPSDSVKNLCYLGNEHSKLPVLKPIHTEDVKGLFG